MSQGELGHTPEVARLIDDLQIMARRVGARFIPDPEKIKVFEAAAASMKDRAETAKQTAAPTPPSR